MFENYIKTKSAFIFGLDNVLYPERDYLLQVYYLFSEFLSYSEQADAKIVLAFMQEEFGRNGGEGMFEKIATKFNISEQYRQNFERLHQQARLPLKLLLYQQMLMFLQAIIEAEKKIFLLVDGDPQMQLNKIRQMEWNGTENQMVTYFGAEFEESALAFILRQHQLKHEDVLLIGASKLEEIQAENKKIAYLDVKKLLS